MTQPNSTAQADAAVAAALVKNIRIKYGALTRETEQEDLRRGFSECWRVLAPGGTLVFKWADKLERVERHFPAPPIVGTRSPRGGQTRWFVFYKPLHEIWHLIEGDPLT